MAGKTARAGFTLLEVPLAALILGLGLAHGGHLTHGMKLNFSGKYVKAGS